MACLYNPDHTNSEDDHQQMKAIVNEKTVNAITGKKSIVILTSCNLKATNNNSSSLIEGQTRGKLTG